MLILGLNKGLIKNRTQPSHLLTLFQVGFDLGFVLVFPLQCSHRLTILCLCNVLYIDNGRIGLSKQQDLRQNIKLLKPYENETKTLKFTVILFPVTFLCLPWRFAARESDIFKITIRNVAYTTAALVYV